MYYNFTVEGKQDQARTAAPRPSAAFLGRALKVARVLLKLRQGMKSPAKGCRQGASNDVHAQRV